jgi:hypothetical protein
LHATGVPGVGVAGMGVDVMATVGIAVAIGIVGVNVGRSVGVAVGAARLQAVAAMRSVTISRNFLGFISTSH